MRQSSLDFLIVGVQKAGTTFLAKVLSENKGIYFSDEKELFFFSQKVNRRAFETYLHENFWKAQSDQLVGEGTTTYFQTPRACKQILEYLGPDIKIIVCLRHPVERMLSHYLHDYKRKRMQGDEQIDSDVFAVYRERSVYAGALTMWQRDFKNIHIMLFEDLVKSGSAFFQDAAGFLGITPHAIVDRPINEGMRLVWNGDDLTIATPPKPGMKKPVFPRSDLERMIKFFGPDIEKTSKLIGRDLSSWHDMPPFESIQEKFKKSDVVA